MFLNSLHHVFVNWIWSRSFPTLASDTRSLLIQANYFLSAVFFIIFDCTFKPLFVVITLVVLHFSPFTVSCRIFFLVHFGTFSSLLSNLCKFFVQSFEFPFFSSFIFGITALQSLVYDLNDGGLRLSCVFDTFVVNCIMFFCLIFMGYIFFVLFIMSSVMTSWGPQVTVSLLTKSGIFTWMQMKCSSIHFQIDR